MSLPALGVLIAGVFAMGVLATHPSVQAESRQPSAIAPVRVNVEGSPLRAGLLQLALVTDSWFHAPPICWNGRQVNDFQKEQCTDFWVRTLKATGVAGIPFGIVAIFLILGLDHLNTLYRRSRKEIGLGRAVFAATAGEPVKGERDWFAYTFCFRKLKLKAADGRWTEAYFPAEASLPLPGQQLAVFDVGQHWGAKRRVAVTYTPHIAVVAGISSK